MTLWRAKPQPPIGRHRVTRFTPVCTATRRHRANQVPVSVLSALLLTLNSIGITPSAVASGPQDVAQGAAAGVIRIDAEDEDSVLSNLLNEAMSYISGSSQDSGPVGTPTLDNGDELLTKLRKEQERLKLQAQEEATAKKEREAARQEAIEKAKAEAEQKRMQEEERKRVEAARKAAEEEAMKKVREEEALKRTREVEARKAAEGREKEEREMRLRAERERQESERLRQLEGAQRRRDQVLAAAGGASVGVVVSIAGEVFRSIGGPTIIAMALRTPGVVVGKQFRVVEWDIQNSPREPDGPCVTINIRATQLNPKGLRTEISKAYRLDSSKQVKQFRHCFVFGPIIFYEQLDNPQAINKLQEGGIIVWTRACPSNRLMSYPVSPSKLVMPSRNDRLPSHTEAGVKVEAVSTRAEESASKYIRRIAAATALICRWSRGDFRTDMDTKIVQEAAELGNSSSMSSINGAGEEGGQRGSEEAIATIPALSCDWLLSNGLDPKVSNIPEVQAKLTELGAVTLEEEGRIIACVFNNDKVVLDLFEAFADTSIFRFVAYAQAYVGRGLSGSGYDDT